MQEDVEYQIGLSYPVIAVAQAFKLVLDSTSRLLRCYECISIVSFDSWIPNHRPCSLIVIAGSRVLPLKTCTRDT